MLYVHEAGGSHPESLESVNGITPAMRNARKRHFKPVTIPVEDMAGVEDDLRQIVTVLTELAFKTLHSTQHMQCRFVHDLRPAPEQSLTCMLLHTAD